MRPCQIYYFLIMFIYKITNTINNKIYIGQVYNKTIQDRFMRHISAASPNSPSYLGRAIYKYGKENFIVEEIDKASSLEELNKKEIFWIKFFNSIGKNIGYNLTLGGDGVNTYLCKTEEELKLIKEKISKANSGKNNGMSKQIKALNINTNQIIHFNTLNEACKYFNIKQKGIFIKYCNGNAKRFWRKEWTFAYENDNFNISLDKNEYDRSCNAGTKVKCINLITNEVKKFNSINKCLEFLNKHKGEISFKKSNICLIDNFRIEKIKK